MVQRVRTVFKFLRGFKAKDKVPPTIYHHCLSSPSEGLYYRHDPCTQLTTFIRHCKCTSSQILTQKMIKKRVFVVPEKQETNNHILYCLT